MSWFKRKSLSIEDAVAQKVPQSRYVSPYQNIYDAIASDDPDERERGYAALTLTGPVPGSFGDRNSYGTGPCGHMAPYPGCPKCRRKP